MMLWLKFLIPKVGFKVKISKMDIPLEVARRIMTFICRADEEFRKKIITESKDKKKKKNSTIWEDLYG